MAESRAAKRRAVIAFADAVCESKGASAECDKRAWRITENEPTRTSEQHEKCRAALLREVGLDIGSIEMPPKESGASVESDTKKMATDARAREREALEAAYRACTYLTCNPLDGAGFSKRAREAILLYGLAVRKADKEAAAGGGCGTNTEGESYWRGRDDAAAVIEALNKAKEEPK